MKIKKINMISLAKIFGVLYGLLGLLMGGLFSIFSIIFQLFSNSTGPKMFGFLGIGSIIAFPIFYGLMGFVSGIIGALLYNIVASWVGGLEIETEK
ncbi:MAG: hypothetical protein ACOC1K_02710 [Nanoarchaeota archaeon]